MTESLASPFEPIRRGRSLPLLGCLVVVVASGCGAFGRGESRPRDGHPWLHDRDPSEADAGGDPTPATGAGGGEGSGGAGHSEDAGAGPSRAGDGGVTVDAAPEEPPEPPPAPSVTSASPMEGAFGTEVTLSGVGLGSAARPNVFLIMGEDEIVLTPEHDAISSWDETEIKVRIPFPAEGEITIETPQGTATAGEFIATWVPAWSGSLAPGASLIASVSARPNHVAMLFDTSPATLLQVEDGQATQETVDLSGVVPSSVELYVTPEGLVDGIALSTEPAPTLVHLTRVEQGLEPQAPGIALDATEYALAGGPDGAAAWMRREDGWARARPGDAGWAIDRSGITDPLPNARRRAAGATSDGALYVAHAIDVGNFFDDMEAPFFRRLGPSDSTFGSDTKVGSNTDDYLTSLELDSRGRGVVVRYCGSDIDPFALTPTAYRCYTGGVSTDGVVAPKIPNEGFYARHAFARRALLEAACDSQGTLRLSTHGDSEPGEAVIWPCPTVAAVEIDPEGAFLPVISVGDSLHLMQRRESSQ